MINESYTLTTNRASSGKLLYTWCLVIGTALMLSSCSINKQIAKQASRTLLKDSVASTGHLGISIYDPASGKYWYNYNATKYFVPASNTKLFSLYAGMKYLGDSLVGLRYKPESNGNNISIEATGDPTFLHADFKKQPVYDFLKSHCNHLAIALDSNFKTTPLGAGWAWDDFNEDYMPERSGFPINGNLVTFSLHADSITAFPALFNQKEYSNLASWNSNQSKSGKSYKITRKKDENAFTTMPGQDTAISAEITIPFITDDTNFTISLLKNILGCELDKASFNDGGYNRLPNVIHSQPSDSLFKPMMYRSDNFFAEQTLLMVSNERLGYMSDEKIIDTLLRTDLKDIPQKPQWADGSGLSRYNLFTPQSFVYILNKLKDEFGLSRLKNILPTGGTGTLSSYYKKDAGFIFAKTGTLNNHCALSGFIITKKNKLLIFSVLANNYQGSATFIRRAIEKFVTGIREKY